MTNSNVLLCYGLIVPDALSSLPGSVSPVAEHQTPHTGIRLTA
ncbi:hypothetical protein [Spirulina major]|nr:hypothetical protein [Spirulina major]